MDSFFCAAGAVRETWEIMDQCPAGIVVIVPSLHPANTTTFHAAAIHRPQWHDGQTLASPLSPALMQQRVAEVAAASVGGAGSGAELSGFWAGDVLLGQRFCTVALELESLV